MGFCEMFLMFRMAVAIVIVLHGVDFSPFYKQESAVVAAGCLP